MKKIALAMVAIVAILVLAACGGPETSASTPPSPAASAAPAPATPSTSVDPASAPADPKDTTPAAPAPSTPADSTRDPVGPSAPETTPVPADSAHASPAAPVAPEPVPEPTDPYELLAISIEEATQTPGTYILRNGKCYNYGKRSADFYDKTGVGYKYPSYTTLALPLTKSAIALIGDLPIIKVEPGDELITVGDARAYATELEKNPGYTFILTHDSSSGAIWRLFTPGCEWNSIVDVEPGYVKQFEICGADGNPVDPEFPYNFAKGELCTLSWFQGTTYCEYPITADFMSFTGKIYDQRMTQEGTLSKNGYAVQDLSIYEPGYWLFDQSLILLIE